MTTHQKAAILGVAMATVAMGIYPPWVHIAQWQERRYAYGWIFNPPPGPMRVEEQPFNFKLTPEKQQKAGEFDYPPEKEQKEGNSTKPEPRWHTELDVTRLIVQWLTVCSVGAAVYFAWPLFPFPRVRSKP
jgi:hypothetical protein